MSNSYSANQLIKSDPDSIAKAVAQIVDGNRPVSIPHREKAEVLNDINALGYSLLKNALNEMNVFEIKFAASMCGSAALSGKQRDALKKITFKYLGIDIDAGSVATSAAAPVAEPAADAPKRKRGRPSKNQISLVRSA